MSRSKFVSVSASLVGAPDTIEKLVEAKLEDLRVLVGGDHFVTGIANEIKAFKRSGGMAHTRSSMDSLGKILSEIFPGVNLIDTNFTAKAGERDQLRLTLVGNMGILMDPEASMDPDILKILHARRSAKEMRNDGE